MLSGLEDWTQTKLPGQIRGFQWILCAKMTDEQASKVLLFINLSCVLFTALFCSLNSLISQLLA